MKTEPNLTRESDMADLLSLPWSRSFNAEVFSPPRVWIYCTRGPNNPSIASVRPSCFTEDKDALSEVDANADLIVRAVNSHAALVEAVKDALCHLEAATSSYREFSGNKDKPGKRDALYSTRLSDYESACVRVRAAYLKVTGGE